MIILDTNIVSEVMRPKPNDIVMQWLENQDIENLYITSISMAEISKTLNSVALTLSTLLKQVKHR